MAAAPPQPEDLVSTTLLAQTLAEQETGSQYKPQDVMPLSAPVSTPLSPPILGSVPHEQAKDSAASISFQDPKDVSKEGEQPALQPLPQRKNAAGDLLPPEVTPAVPERQDEAVHPSTAIATEQRAVKALSLEEQLAQAMAKHDTLAAQNAMLQTRISHLQVAKFSSPQLSSGKTVTAHAANFDDENARYDVALKEFSRVLARKAAEETSFSTKLASAKAALERERKENELASAAFVNLVHEYGHRARFQNSGRPIEDTVIEKFLARYVKGAAALEAALQKHLLAENTHRHLQAQVKAKTEQSGGASMMAFEQLRMENQRLQDRADEAAVKLLRERAAAESAVHVMAHGGEKAESLKQEIVVLEGELRALETQVLERQQEVDDVRADRQGRLRQATLRRQPGSKVADQVMRQEYQELLERIARFKAQQATTGNAKSVTTAKMGRTQKI